jgi:hypothetical protein
MLEEGGWARERAESPTAPTAAAADPPRSDFTSLLLTLKRVPGVFDDAYRPFRFRIEKSAACLICSAIPAPAAGEDLDEALDQALARLGNE